MGKKYSKTTRRIKRYTLSPKDAETIIKQEFTDSRGNKHIFNLEFRPQNPLKPDYTQTIEYKDRK